MNQKVDILCRARALYASAPSHASNDEWPKPGTYCVVYALSEIDGGLEHHPFEAARTAFEAAIGTDNIVEWNAEHSTEEVLAAFDRAILAEGLRVPDLQRVEQHDLVGAGQES